MTSKRKIALYLTGGSVGAILGLSILWLIFYKPFTSQLPTVEDTHLLSQPVKDQLSTALAKAKRNPSTDHLGMLAMVYHSSANYPQAAVCYKLAIARDDSEWIWSYYLGYLFTELGNSKEAILHFSRVLELNPKIDHAWYYSGEEYKNLGEYGKAAEFMRKIRPSEGNESKTNSATRKDHFPLETYAKFQLARILFDAGDNDLAELTLKEILEIHRTFGPAYRLLGNLYSLKGDMALSERYGVRANELMEYSPPVDSLIDRLSLLSKSELYLPKKIDEAISAVYPQWALTLINQALAYFPDDKYLITKAIRAKLWLEQNDEAFKYIGQHINSFQNDFNELYDMGLFLYDKELYTQAIGYWQRALILNPGDLDIQKKLTISYWKLGEMDKSEKTMDEILKSNPEDFEVLAEVAEMMFFEIEKQQKALGYLVLLDHFVSSNPKVQKMSAWVAQANGAYKEAISLYGSSFKGDPEDFTTIKNLGDLYVSQKMWEQSIQLFREALGYHPNEPYYLERLGNLLVNCPDSSLRDLKEAQYYSERAFTHATDNTMIVISAGRNLAIASLLLGEKQYALLVLNSTIQLARQRDVSKENLAVLEELGKELF